MQLLTGTLRNIQTRKKCAFYSNERDGGFSQIFSEDGDQIHDIPAKFTWENAYP